MTDLHLVKATDISADGDTVFLAYSDYRYGDREIMGNISYDGGRTWQGEIRLTDAPGQSVEPSCELRDGVAHLTWCDGRLDPQWTYYEVYYKRGESIRIYDITGRLVRVLETTNKEGGEIKAAWDAKDNSGKDVSSGVYFARVSTPQAVKIKKLLYLR